MFAAPLRAALLIDTNSTWRFLKGTNEASLPDRAAWRSAGFADTNFTNAPAPFWYGDTNAGGTQLTDMINNYSCIFLRHSFVVSNVAEIGALRLGAFVDDGFVAWINGTEVQRVNLPDPPGTAVAITNLASNATEPVPFNFYDLSSPAAYLVEGTNVLAVQVFNTTLNSSDLGFDASLTSIITETNPPVIVAIEPPPGEVTNLTQITVTFSERVTGVTPDLLLINRFSATGLTGSNATYTFSFPQPAYGGVSITWATNQGIMDFAAPPNLFNATAPGATWQYTLTDVIPPTVVELTPRLNAIVRRLTQIEVRFSENVAGVEAADLLINGQPAATVLAQPPNRYLFQFPEPLPGPVQVAWAETHGITDLAAIPNLFAGGAWSYQLDPNAAMPDLVINEILAANENGLEDEDVDPVTLHGQRQDWIEIYNRGANSVDLDGWSLSDDPNVPGQWVFPPRVLGPGQYLVVFASGKDRKQPTGTNLFHTNFQLSRAGEFLGLYSPDSPRELVSGFAPAFPEQRNDYSYGFDSAGQWRYFATPTPGGPNGASTIVGVAAPVHFSAERGHYTQAFDLALSTATPGGMIRYTMDGSEPTATTGQIYLGPLRITATMLLRAAAFRTNFLPSTVGTHTYLFNATAAIRSLPVLSIVTAQNNLTGPTGIIGISNVVVQADGSYLPAVVDGVTNGYHNPSLHGIAWERPTSVEFIRPEDNSGFQVDCGIRVQGSDYQRPRTLATSKFSFRLYFRGDYGPGRLEYPLFPLTTLQSFDVIVLRAGFNDPDNPFCRDELTRRLSQDQGQVASHGTFVNLFINGVYKGYYNPCERVNEEFAQAYHGGGDDWDVVSPNWAISSGESGVVDGDRKSFVSLVNYINQNNPATPAIYQEIGRRLDLVNFVDYLLLNVYAGMGDWPGNNFRAGKDRGPGGIWRFYVWDGEWGFGIYDRVVTRDSFAESGGGPDNSGLASTGYSEIAQMYQRLRASAEFRLLFADRIQKHFFNGGALMDANITARFNEMRTNLLGVIPSMNTSILTTWVAQRRGIVMGHFDTYDLLASSNAPGFNQFGGRVPRGFNLVITNLAGTIYYTTNGADPRVKFSGAVAADAAAYTGPLTLNQDATVRARSLNGTNWSALTEASFQVALLGVPLRVTEINYNPPGGSAYEFLELQNVGGNTLDLSGMYFDEGITFTFNQGPQLAAGATVVLISNNDTNAFRERYPEAPIGGVFAGQLANGGERITLRDRNGQVVFTADYDDENGWPTGPDGGGPSLEIINPLGNPDDPANWRASSVVYGTPGTVTPPPPPASVVLNEIMATNHTAVANGATHPDWIELHNPGAAAVDLSGWSLSDDGNPRKFVFPPGTSLDTNGYLVVWCDDATNTTPGLHAGFALRCEGESIFLYNASTTLVDVVTFGLQLPDYSIGRLAGAWQLTAPTPNAANVAAATGAATNLAINEWLANALPGLPDWLELYNRSATLPVPLQGCWLASTNGVCRLSALSFLAPDGFLQLFADEGVGPDHLDFKLPATGGAIILYDPLAVEIARVNYGVQAEGISQGRLPDGNTNAVSFPGSASPGAANYTNSYSGPYINEVLARNDSAVTNCLGQTADFIELYNPGADAFDLSGMSLSVDRPEPGQWRFPFGTTIPGLGYLVIWCDGSQPASIIPGPCLNAGHSLDGDGGGVYLFNAAGQIVNAVEYGFQVENLPIGRVSGQWRLLSAVTPGATNAAAAALGPVTGLRLNEWMAAPAAGDDWFEIYNPTNLPVDLSRLYLSDDLSLAGQVEDAVAPLSFIGPRHWVKFIADGKPDQGRDHVNFALDAEGDSLRLYTTSFAVIDSVCFGRQLVDVAEGRLPDGQANIVAFPGSASPGESNYRLLENVVINEVLPAAAPSLSAAVELHNPSDSPINVGGWYLSDSPENFRKYRLPEGSVIAAGGFLVVFENAFKNGTSNSFTFDAAWGGEVWLAAADAAGNLTGYRAGAKFGPALDGVSAGRFPTSAGAAFVALSVRTFGVPNAGAKVGPVVINEIMYHPAPAPDGIGDDEYIELYNLTAAEVPLYDPAYPANVWRLADAVEFQFPSGITLPGEGYLLVVNFDPVANPAALAAFRSRYGVADTVPVYGPYSGKLDNAGENLELYQPRAPIGPSGFVPLILADRVDYQTALPWPAGAVDGGGLSLQRRSPSLYGNEPTNWVAAAPTPGAANGPGAVPPPIVTESPAGQSLLADATLSLQAAGSGAGPLSYQWRFNGRTIAGATNTALVLPYAQPEDSGLYDVLVSNAGGSAVSAPARVTVFRMPEIVTAPLSQVANAGLSVVMNVLARGSAPLSYQWRLNGAPLAGATNATLTVTNIQVANEGEYEVIVANPAGEAAARATLTVLVRPAFVQAPLAQTVVAGGDLSLSAVISGNPPPFTFSWRRVSPSVIFTNAVTSARSNFFTLNTTANGLVLASNMLATNISLRLTVSNLATAGSSMASTFAITLLADTDQDGLPDVWESAYEPAPGSGVDPALDSDGDGMSNGAEYLAGTDPTNALSYLKIEFAGRPGPAAVQFAAVSNKTYSVEYCDALGTAPWLKLDDVVARKTNRVEVLADPAWTSNRFYRVVTPWQR